MPFRGVETGSGIKTKRINIMSASEKQSPVDGGGDEMDGRKGLSRDVSTWNCPSPFRRHVLFFLAHYLLLSLKKKGNLKCQPLQGQPPELGSKTQLHFSALVFSSENPFSSTPSLSIHLPSSHPLQLPSHLPALNNCSRGDGRLHQPRWRKGPRRRFGLRGSCPSLRRPIN